jgi:hypothetical protein
MAETCSLEGHYPILFLYSNESKFTALKRVPLILIILIIFLWPSCEKQGACTTDVISRVNAGFYVRDSLGDRDTVLNNFTFYGLSRPDSLIHDSSMAVQTIEFPLPHNPGEYTSYFFGADSLSDLLSIVHSASPQLVSYDCGFTTVHDIIRIDYDNNIIDTITITNPFVSLSDEENLKIYIKPLPVLPAQ